jgi:hypothetical protein
LDVPPSKDPKPYTIGEPFDISVLTKAKPSRAASTRDVVLEKAIMQAAAAAESQVIRFLFDPEEDKVATVKAAAKRIVKAMDVPVNVGYSKSRFPNAILLSRGVLSNRSRPSK